MCNIDINLQAILDQALPLFLSALDHAQRSNFTAYEFVELTGCEVPRATVSEFLRDRFNHGEMIGWGTTITEKGGPILYFRVVPSSPAGRRVRQINERIASQSRPLPLRVRSAPIRAALPATV